MWLKNLLLAGSFAISQFPGLSHGADQWPNWRGPNGNGTAAEGDYPHAWGANKNLAWSARLAGKGSSTPIVWDDKIAVTSSDDGENIVSCLDRSGQKLWKATLGTARDGKHRKATGANSSPITDGEKIFVYFKSGDLGAVDWKGNVLWQENLQQKYGPDTLWWDLGTSPVLTDKFVVVSCIQSGPSWLAAFDKKTGREAWKVDRIVEAPGEAAQAYTTPVVTTFDGQQQIIVLGADHVTCHSAEDGKELWRVGGLNPGQIQNFRSIASPVVADGVVIAPYSRGGTITAIKLGGKGDVTKSHVLWTKTMGKESALDVPSPAVRDGEVYLCGDKGVVTCLDLKTGKEFWSKALEKHRVGFSSSPILSGDTLYLLREDATAYLMNIKDQSVQGPFVVAEGESSYATPVLVDNEILLRTHGTLFCIQEGGAKSVSAK